MVLPSAVILYEDKFEKMCGGCCKKKEDVSRV